MPLLRPSAAPEDVTVISETYDHACKFLVAVLVFDFILLAWTGSFVVERLMFWKALMARHHTAGHSPGVPAGRSQVVLH